MRNTNMLAGIAAAGLVTASLVLGAPASAATVNGTGGNDHLRGTPHSDTIRGQEGNDRVYAFAGADLIFGGKGSDHVDAGRGDDTIRGGNGLDSLNGGRGGDVIFGGKTEDFLFDGPGTDTIYGGLDGDYIYLTKDGTADTVTCGAGSDVVWNATSVNTVADDCESVNVGPPACRSLSQRVLPPLREAARC